MRMGPINQSAVAALARSLEVDTGARAEATKMLAEARRNAPVRTGRTRRSLTVVKVGDEYRVGWDLSVAPHALYVEFGTNDTPAQPHLRPAARKRRR